MKSIDTIIAIINLCLLVFYILFKDNIKLLWQWITACNRKVTLQINKQNYSLCCLQKDLLLIEHLKYMEMERTEIRTHKRGARLYLQAIVRSRDISDDIQNAFNNQNDIKLIDSDGNDFSMAIAHLSKNGIKSNLTLIGIPRLLNGKIPKGSVLEIHTSLDDDPFVKMLGQSLRDIDNNVWRVIYKDKIKPHMDKK